MTACDPRHGRSGRSVARGEGLSPPCPSLVECVHTTLPPPLDRSIASFSLSTHELISAAATTTAAKYKKKAAATVTTDTQAGHATGHALQATSRCRSHQIEKLAFSSFPLFAHSFILFLSLLFQFYTDIGGSIDFSFAKKLALLVNGQDESESEKKRVREERKVAVESSLRAPMSIVIAICSEKKECKPLLARSIFFLSPDTDRFVR